MAGKAVKRNIAAAAAVCVVLIQQPKAAALEGEQPMLDRQPPAVAGQPSVRANHAMTGNDDGQRIAAVGETDRSRRRWLTNLRRERAVRDRPAVGNVEQRAPDSLLKGRPVGRERQVEHATLAFEVFLEL